MFTTYKRVEEEQTVEKQVRANMKVALHLTGTEEVREYEVVSSSKGVLVLRDLHYALDIVASEDLNHFETLLSKKSFSVERVVITANGKEYAVAQDGENIHYMFTSMVSVNKNIEVKVGDELTVSIDEGENWDDATVLDVTPTQLLAKIESKVGNDYLVFNNSTETEMNGHEYELVDVNYK